MQYTQEELWEIQTTMWPTSERMTPYEVIHWAGSWPSHRAMAVLMSIQYPGGIYYRIPVSHDIAYHGYRFGLEPHQYLSFP